MNGNRDEDENRCRVKFGNRHGNEDWDRNWVMDQNQDRNEDKDRYRVRDGNRNRNKGWMDTW